MTSTAARKRTSSVRGELGAAEAPRRLAGLCVRVGPVRVVLVRGVLVRGVLGASFAAALVLGDGACPDPSAGATAVDLTARSERTRVRADLPPHQTLKTSR